MKFAYSIAALLLPAVAAAQPLDPDDPTDPNAPQPVTVEPSQAPAPAAPVVVVNPPPPAPTYTAEPSYETYTSPWNAPMFTSGAIVFLGSYGAALVVAATSEDDVVDRGNDRLY